MPPKIKKKKYGGVLPPGHESNPIVLSDSPPQSPPLSPIRLGHKSNPIVLSDSPQQPPLSRITEPAPSLPLPQQPRLSPITKPALSQPQQPRLSPITKPALSQPQQPRLSPITKPALQQVNKKRPASKPLSERQAQTQTPTEEPATMGKKPKAAQAGPSQAPAGPAPAPAPAPAQTPAELNKQLLLSALDSYHDFGDKKRANIIHDGLILKTIEKFIKKNHKVLDEFKELIKPDATGKTLEKRVYEEYVKNNDDIYEGAKFELNDEKGKQFDDDIDEELDSVLKNNDVCYISDAGALIKCNKTRKYINSFASWFDKGSGCTHKAAPANIIPYNDEISLTKENNNQLLYIKKFAGKIDDNNNATATVTLPPSHEIVLEEGRDNNLRPEVSKYAAIINANNKTPLLQFEQKFFTHLSDTDNNTDNKCMLIMDLKRSGDRLQIKCGSGSGNGLVMNQYGRAIFITSDIIAATIAVNNNVITFFTTRDGSRKGNKHAIKYAQLLIPTFMLSPEQIDEAIIIGKINKLIAQITEYTNEFKKKFKTELKKKRVISESKNYEFLLSIGPPDNSESTKTKTTTKIILKNNIKNCVDTLKSLTLTEEKYKATQYLIIIRYLNSIIVDQTYDKTKVRNDLKDVFKEIFTEINTAKKKLLEQLNNNYMYVLINIQNYCGNKSELCCSNAMKEYLKYIIEYITKLKETKCDIDDLLDFYGSYTYDNITSIETIITSGQGGQMNGTHYKNRLGNMEGFTSEFLKNLYISVHIYKILLEDTHLYKSTIGKIAQPGSGLDNHVIMSPVGRIFIEKIVSILDKPGETEEKKKNLLRSVNTNEFSQFSNTDKTSIMHPYAKHLIRINDDKDDRIGLIKAIFSYLEPNEKTAATAATTTAALKEFYTHDNNQSLSGITIKEQYGEEQFKQLKDALKYYYDNIAKKHKKYMDESLKQTEIIYDSDNDESSKSPSDLTDGGAAVLGRIRFNPPIHRTYNKLGPKTKKEKGILKKDLLNNFMNLSYTTKIKVIQKYDDESKNIMLKAIFNKYYKRDNYDVKAINKELLLIRSYKKKHNIRGFVRMRKKPQPQPHPRTQKKPSINELAFTLFKETLDLYPEYIDPVMVMYMIYTNSKVPTI